MRCGYECRVDPSSLGAEEVVSGFLENRLVLICRHKHWIIPVLAAISLRGDQVKDLLASPPLVLDPHTSCVHVQASVGANTNDFVLLHHEI